MDYEKIGEKTYKEAFQILAVALNEMSRILMTAATECDDLFMKAIEESLNSDT